MILAVIAVSIGLFSLICLDALVNGISKSMIKNAINTFSGSAQIHAKNFRDDFEIEKFINQLDRVKYNLRSEKKIKSFTLRTQSFCMLSSPQNVESVMLYGIKPETEKNISLIDNAVIKGKYLNSKKSDKILIGEKLSKLLKVDVNDKIVVTLSQAHTGDLCQELFRVGGIFRLNIREMDSKIAFITLAKSQQILNIGTNVHEIVLKTKQLNNKNTFPANFQAKYSSYNNEALTWKDLIPGIETAIKVSRFSTYIMGLLLFAIVAVVVTNTIFMSLYERMYEFGILRAVGTRSIQMAQIILTETAILCAAGILLGLLLGISVCYIFSIIGISYGTMELGGVTLIEPIYPAISIKKLIIYPIWIFIFTIAAAIFPAIQAARLSPVEAMKKKDR